MDLQELKFRVETKELDDAITKVGELGEAVTKLNTPVAQLAKNTKDAAKSAGDLAQAADKSGKSSKTLADNTDAVNDRLQKLKDQLGFLRNDLNLSQTGLTKMQAGLMSSMKAIGATDTQLKSFASTFDQFNRLMGEQAFDKSVAGLNMLNRQMKEFEITNELAARGANLTSTQVKQLSRDIEALRQQNAEFGRGANDGVDQLKSKYIAAANSVNQYVAAAKEAEQAAKREAQAAIEAAKAHDANNAAIARQYELVRQAGWKEYADGVGKQSDEMKKLSAYYREQEQAVASLDKQRFDAMGNEVSLNRQRKAIIDEATKAEQYMTREAEKLIFVNEKLAQGFGTASANALFRYQEALQKTGRTADQVEKELADLGKELMKKQGTSPISMIQKDVQKLDQSVNHLSRNIGVQFTDIFVSLANGQSIFQVVTQQGGQLADAFLLAGISGQNMGNQLVEGAKAIFNSYKVLGSAFLDLGGRAISGAGEAIVNFGMRMTGTDVIVNTLKRSLASMGEEGFTAIGALTKIGGVISASIGAAVGILAAGTLLMAVAITQVIKEQQALNIALNTTGASLGLSTDAAIDLSRTLGDVGVNSTTAISTLTEMAKAGALPKEAFESVATAANAMQNYVGISVDKTVADFNKLAKDPAKNLAELAGKTGYVTLETLNYIQALQDEGKEVEAVQAAVEAMAEAKIKAAESAYASASPLIQLWTDIKIAVRNAWSEFKDATAQGQGLAALFRTAWETVAVIVSEVWYVLKMTGKEIGGIAAQIAAVMSGDFAGAKRIGEMMKEDAEAARAAQDKLVASILSGNQRVNASNADVRQKNAADAAGFDKMLKDREKAQKEAEAARKKAAAEAARLENEYNKYAQKSLESVRDLAIQTDLVRKGEEETTKAAKMRADLMDDPLWAKHSEQYKINILAALDILEAQEKINKEVEKEKKLREEMQKENFKKMSELEDIYDDITKNQEEQKKLLEDSSKDINLQYSLIGKSADEQKVITDEYNKQNKLKKALLAFEKEIAEIRKLENSGVYTGEETNKMRKQAELNYAEEVRQINSETALIAAQDYDKAFREIQGTITDIISTALFEGGKAGQKKIKDVLKASFRKFVIDVFINPIVKGGMNAVLGISGGGSAGGIGSIVTGGINDYLTNTALGTVLTSSAGYAAAIGGGSMAAGSQAAMLAAQTSGFGVAGTALTAQAAGGAAGAAGGAYSTVMNGLASMGPAGWAALAIGALLMSGIGETPGEQHMGGMYSTRGSALDMETARSITGGGGWDDGAWARDLTERSSDQVSAVLSKIVDGALGEANDAIALFGKSAFTIDAGMAANINGEGTDKNVFGYFNLYDEAGKLVKEYVNRELGTDLAAAVQKFGGDIQEAVASVVLEGTNFKREGETNVQTLVRLRNSLTAVNQVTDLLGMKSLDLSLAGGDAASSLVDMFGSIENLQTASASFYDTFASDEIKIADATNAVTSAFTQLGIEIPKSTDAYYELVKGLDLSTEAGRNSYAVLLGVSGAFDFLATSAEDAEAAIEDSKDALNERKSLENELLQLQGNTVELRRRELEALDPSNRALQEFIWSLEDIEEAAKNARDAAAAVQNILNNGLTSAQSATDVALGKLQDAYDREEERLNKQIEDQNKQAKAEYDLAVAALNDQKKALELSKDAQSKSLDSNKELQDGLNDVISNLKDLSQFLGDTVKELYGEVSSTAGMQASSAMAYLRSVASGSAAADADKIKESVDTVRGSMTENRFATKVDFDRERLQLAGMLSGIKTTRVDPQLAVAESQLSSLKAAEELINKQIESIESQSELLETQLSNLSDNQLDSIEVDRSALTELRNQIDTLRGIDTTLLTIPQALQAVAAAIAGEKVASEAAVKAAIASATAGLITNDQFKATLDSAGVNLAAGENTVAGSGVYQSAAGAVSVGGMILGTNGGSISQQGAKDYILAAVAAGNERDVYNRAAMAGISLDDVDKLAGWSDGTAEAWAIANKLPTFADGGFYSGGMALVGEEGPELINFNQPGQVYTAGQTAGMLGNSAEVVEAIERLNANISALRIEVKADSSANSKVAKLLERVSPDGQSLNVNVIT